MHPRSIAALVLVVLAGCAPPTTEYHWKQGGSLALIDRDLFQCRANAARDVPVDTRVAQTPIYQTPIQTICKPGATPGETVCTTTGGEVFGGDIYTYDANTQLRSEYQARCMAAKGYAVATVPLCAPKVVPADITAIARKGSRAPRDGACAVSLKGGASVILYPEEFR